MIKQSKQDIYYSPSTIKTYLDKSINYAIFGIQNYCLDPISDFTRSRKLPANTLIRYIMNLSNRSTSSEMCNFFLDIRKLPANTLIRYIMNLSNRSTSSEMCNFFLDIPDMPTPSALCQLRKLLDPAIFKVINRLFLNLSNRSTSSEMCNFFLDIPDMPTPSALCQLRKLLDPAIFKVINRLFLSSVENYSTINGYRILAQDCSDVNIPFKDDETKISYHQKEAPFCQYHINALYDCLNHVFLDWPIDASTKKGESEALIPIIKKATFQKKLFSLLIVVTKATIY